MNQKKKLLVTASTFPRWEGDTEPRFILDLVSHMTNEFDVTVLAPAAPGTKNRESLEGVGVIRYHYFPIHKWETLCYPGAIIPRIKERKVRAFLVPFLFISLFFHLIILFPRFDIVHAHWIIPQGIVQSFFKKPYIVTGHGGDISSMNSGILRKLKERCLSNAKMITVVSKYKQQELERLYPGYQNEIISMGVDTTLFEKKTNYVQNYFGQNNKNVILYVGRLAEIKGIYYLIKAMSYVKDAILIIVGEGPERQKLEYLAKESQNEIYFWGSKTHKELKKIYASADVFVVPSITDDRGAQEGLPTVIMEAMASGLPVVASNTGGIPQLIKDEISGLLCEEKNVEQLANSINKLLSDERLRQRIIDMAYEAIKEYDYKTIAERYKRIINQYL